MLCLVLLFSSVPSALPAYAAETSSYTILDAGVFLSLTAREINDELLALEAAYPDLIHHAVIGRSTGGCDILRMRLTLPDAVAPQSATTTSAVDTGTAAPAPATTLSAIDADTAAPATTPSAIDAGVTEPTTTPSAVDAGTAAPVTTPAAAGMTPTPAAVTTPAAAMASQTTAAAFEAAWLARGKPAILVEAGTHARETANPYITYRMLASYAQDTIREETIPVLRMKDLLAACAIDFVVLSNPDGYDVVRHGRKTFTVPAILSFLNTIREGRYPYFKATATGVDLNRNYPATYFNVATNCWVDLWGKRQNGKPMGSGFVSKIPSTMFYGGPKPASEPETRAMASLIRSMDYRMVLSFHSMGNVIYYDRPYLSAAYNQEARRYADRARLITGYRTMATYSKDNYSGYFGDFVANETQKPCLTVETTGVGFPTSTKAAAAAYAQLFSLPYRMAELALKDGYRIPLHKPVQIRHDIVQHLRLRMQLVGCG